ncbi:hypothetical protein F5051DRAFT_446268 [Lentinula edodes]|nr:hypothetical protein F5051DRAFT_446268 [Lentinula edodes]
MRSAEILDAIRRNNTNFSPAVAEAFRQIYGKKHHELNRTRSHRVVRENISYGPHERNVLDVYLPAEGAPASPVSPASSTPPASPSSPVSPASPKSPTSLASPTSPVSPPPSSSSPSSPGYNRPVMIYVHGGGLVAGDKVWYKGSLYANIDILIADIAAAPSIVVFSSYGSACASSRNVFQSGAFSSAEEPGQREGHTLLAERSPADILEDNVPGRDLVLVAGVTTTDSAEAIGGGTCNLNDVCPRQSASTADAKALVDLSTDTTATDLPTVTTEFTFGAETASVGGDPGVSSLNANGKRPGAAAKSPPAKVSKRK